ncbi:hypothetical protein O181_008780 [Austropuccinia psidii MF-1]|uniref:Uncharacterized protein n=1 Tax=Austropuccinia psidii MF-1 TaxID=1389203 RepID=A0A9Q3BQL3_9BASI|nr:hypothetical protein [Austropuccinia psidii MF-1]
MDLCTCSKCITYTSCLTNGEVCGRMISSRNKRKHLRDSFIQSQTEYLKRTITNNSVLSSSDLDDPTESDFFDSESNCVSIFSEDTQSLPVFVAIFVCWLHLLFSLSWKNCSTVVINTPRCVYYTHKLKTWIEWLLGLKIIEKEITEWKNHLSHQKNIIDIQQIFVDWFNPHGSKISGKQQSIGCIILSCLNLPPKLRNKPAYSMLYSLIPGPNSPDVVTISNVIRPLVDELLELKDGFNVVTTNYPQGRKVYVQLLPAVGDLVAMHKIVGFGSHSASQFCGWCKADLKDLQGLNIGPSKSAAEIREAAYSWKSAKTISLKEKICKVSGVRWSEFHRLPYRFANMHVALGVMHNCLEGVLQENFRYRLGFQDDVQEKKRIIHQKMKSNKRVQRMHESSHTETEESGEEDASNEEWRRVICY